MIETEGNLRYNEAARDGFLAAAQLKINARLSLSDRSRPTLSIQEGPKNIRVVIADDYGARSVFCFIERATGSVLKDAGWKSPEKRNPRSNINDADFGASGITGYGTTYLRG
jgi:hypothetical protein